MHYKTGYRRFICVWIIILAGVIRGQSFRENEMKSPGPDAWSDRTPVYAIMKLPTLTDSVRVIVSYGIPNAMLQFVTRDSLYQGQFELTFVLKDDNNQIVANHIKKYNVLAQNYQEAQSRDQITRHKFQFKVKPGDYNSFIEFFDFETGIPLRDEKNIQIDDFTEKPLSLSDIYFFQQEGESDDSLNTIVPSIPPVRAQSDSSFRARVYIRCENPPEKIRLTYAVLEKSGKVLIQDTLMVSLDNTIETITLPVQQDLIFGNYDFRITILDKEPGFTRTKSFYVQWGKHSTHLTDLEHMIEALSYVMENRQWREVTAMPPDAQKKVYESFWEKRDPTPGTPENELEEEFYKRIQEANKQFSSMRTGTDGWRTDRGRIFVIYGAPSYVEKSPLSAMAGSEFEVWYYTNLKLRFVFMAKYGIGDMRLVRQEGY